MQKEQAFEGGQDLEERPINGDRPPRLKEMVGFFPEKRMTRPHR